MCVCVRVVVLSLCSAAQVAQVDTRETDLVRWHENGDYITPWIEMDDEVAAGRGTGTYSVTTFPRNCGMYSAKS